MYTYKERIDTEKLVNIYRDLEGEREGERKDLRSDREGFVLLRRRGSG